MLRILILLLISSSLKAQNVYKTPSGNKYHLATCRMVNNVSKEISIPEAVKSGLGPCKICKPPAPGNYVLPVKKASGQDKTTFQCNGFTKSGSRCKHRTRIANGYCFQHNPDKPRKSK